MALRRPSAGTILAARASPPPTPPQKAGETICGMSKGAVGADCTTQHLCPRAFMGRTSNSSP